MKETKYHRVTVTMKTGFIYSFACIGRFLEGMKKSSDGYWTKKIEVEDITKEQYDDFKDGKLKLDEYNKIINEKTFKTLFGKDKNKKDEFINYVIKG